MQDRKRRQQEIQTFLQKHFVSNHWKFAVPNGSGNETYFAFSSADTCFVKLGVQISRYEVMASIGLTPPVLVSGYLEDGTPMIVQPYIVGRKPSRKDYHIHLEQIATIINRTHYSPELKQVLPEISSDLYSAAGLASLIRVQQRWNHHRAQVPEVADFVDESLADLTQQVQHFMGAGLVTSHNDICNANWLVSSGGQVYLIDLESMALDDPALDIGATLWWYYPPELRQQFLEIVGYANDEAFQFRMRVRMAMHCLSIILPREQSFDKFDSSSFAQSLTDFRAILASEDNPQGYID